MKNGWETKRIGEVCTVLNGGTPKTGVADYWGGEHRWITPAEMGGRETPYVEETERTLTDAGLANSSARLLPPQSVILSSRAPIGHLVINIEPMAFNQGCKGLVPNNGLHHKFLYYYLGSIVELLDSLGTGATFRELSGAKLKEVRLPVPPLAEQQRIVGLAGRSDGGPRHRPSPRRKKPPKRPRPLRKPPPIRLAQQEMEMENARRFMRRG